MIVDMNIKRFEIESNGIWEWRKKALSWRELCDILNELYEENLRLKEYIKEIEKNDHKN